MDLLIRCSSLWGSQSIIDHDPALAVIPDAFYWPYSAGRVWGLFGSDGASITASVDLREGMHPSPDQVVAPTMPAAAISQTAPDGVYIYGGRISTHYGHFLINTLPRFWNIIKLRTPRTRILCHGAGRPEDWFAIPFIAQAFHLLGLTQHDFVSFDENVRLRSVVIPSTSLEEQKAGYRAYRRLCFDMGERVRNATILEASDRPLYFSKAKLSSAVGHIVNESDMDAVLLAAGVKIVYPEHLPLQEQIRLMSSHERILGSSGSFLHTSIFCSARHITCLNVTEQINTNYTIIDKLSGHDASYFYPPALKILEKREGYLTSRYLPDAAAVAEELLRRM